MAGSTINIPSPNDKPDEDKPLPQFRKDLQLLKGPDDPDGAPTFNLFDPVRSKYYRLSWYEAAILELVKPGMTIKQLSKAMSKRTAMEVTEKDLEAFFYDAKLHNLLDLAHSSEELYKEVESKEVNPFTWILSHYLYIRIPLFKPDAFLESTLKYVKPFASTIAFIIYFAIALSGFFMLMTRFDEFISTFTYFFNWQGIFFYAIAIIFTKVLHELGHAYTAKYYGLHVPVMGIALIILWPVMYTDASDVWKLPSRRQRFSISVAGIVVELVIAGIATWGWFLTSSGVLQSVFFLLASVSWVSSLLINLNPCMRFDGYYLLSDIWGIDNMQTRAFGIAKWKLRQWLLGIDAPPPEIVSHRRMVGMVIYSILTWIYRIFLYSSIALIVYFQFTKVLGIIMFAAAIGMFIVWPLAQEAIDVFKLRRMFRLNFRLITTVVVATALAVWFILPMPATIDFPGVTVPDQNQNVYLPRDGRIVEIFVKKGSQVKKGDPLILITSEELNSEIRSVKLDMQIVKKEILTASLTDENRSIIAPKQEELRALNSRLNSLEQQKETLLLRATISGYVYDWEEDLAVGQALTKDYAVGKIAQLKGIRVIGYIHEDEVGDIKLGQDVTFNVLRTLKKVNGTIKQIRIGRDLTLDYTQLASVYGGDLPTKRGNDANDLKLIESYYIVDIELIDPPAELVIGQLGYVEASGAWRSGFMSLFRMLQRLFYRESGI